MPTSAYSHHTDSKTGEVTLLPQLFPYAHVFREYSSIELENWVTAGLIPKELYEADLQDKMKMSEIADRIHNGEEVDHSEFPKTSYLLTQYLLENKSRLYGENVLKKQFFNLVDSDPDIVWLSFVKEATQNITSVDPQPIHFYTARRILKEKYDIEDSRAVDILSRKILEHCKNISKLKCFNHEVFSRNPINIEDLENHLKHEEHDILQADFDFITYLKSLGSKGKKLATELKQQSEEIFKYYKENGYPESFRSQVWGLWVTKDEPINDVLKVLTQAIWEEEGSRLWKREATGSPAIVKPILDRIIPILSPKKSKDNFIEKDGNVIFFDQFGKPLLTAPAIDPIMISAFKNGVKQLGTLTGHKMLRWQVNKGFERWSTGESDPRLIEVDGGYSGIAEEAKCTSKTDIAKIKEILHAQAYGRFIFPDGSHGNMISLRIEDTYRNNEPSKIRIVLGDMLLPAYVCQFQKSDRRLIPIGDLPPLHGSPNSHASQAQLQLYVFSEFSNQSDRLAETGAVVITLEMWQKMAHESGLNPDKVKEVVAHWCHPDLFNCFLERQGNEYRLGSYYDRAQKFLEIQGKGRIENSERGKRSVEKREKKSKKN